MKLINEINGSKTLTQCQTALKLTKSKNPRPFWERGTTQVVVEGLVKKIKSSKN
jgi:hypothetical protein